MRTSSQLLVALAVLTTSSLAFATPAPAPTPASTPVATPAPQPKTECFNETANLTISFNAMESSAAAAIAFPDAKFNEVKQLLAKTSSDYNLQSMNYSINKNQHNRHAQGQNTTNEWRISGSFSMLFTSVEDAQHALVNLDNAELFPRLNVNKSKRRNCK